MWDAGSTSTVCHSHYDNAMHISEKKNRVLTSLCNNYQHRCVNATCSTYVTRWGQWEIYALVNYTSIGVCNVLSPLHCVAFIYFDL